MTFLWEKAENFVHQHLPGIISLVTEQEMELKQGSVLFCSDKKLKLNYVLHQVEQFLYFSVVVPEKKFDQIKIRSFVLQFGSLLRMICPTVKNNAG